MRRGEVMRHALAKPGAWQDEPWEGDVVAKVDQKIFVFGGGEDATSVGVKCGNSRDDADELVARYPHDVSPSAYIGRFGWNSVTIGGAVPDEEVLELVDESYDAVVAKLPRSRRPQASGEASER